MQFVIHLDNLTAAFYQDVADVLGKPVEFILEDTLEHEAEQVVRHVVEKRPDRLFPVRPFSA